MEQNPAQQVLHEGRGAQKRIQRKRIAIMTTHNKNTTKTTENRNTKSQIKETSAKGKGGGKKIHTEGEMERKANDASLFV